MSQTDAIKSLIIKSEKDRSIDILNKKEVLQNFFQVFEAVINTPDYCNAMVVNQFIMYFLERYEDLSFYDFEINLRTYKSRVYLVAAPLSFYEDSKKFSIQSLDKKVKKPKYALYVCMNGEEEAKELLADEKINSNIQDNRERLKITGVLALK